MKAILLCLALAFPLSAACADNLQFAVISGVDSIQRVRTGSSLFPWERAAPGEIFVSTSCGFALATYRRVTTPVSKLDDDGDTKPWKALVQIGHYCKLNEYVLDGWNLVAYRTWKGKNCLIDFAEINVDLDQRLYVDDARFIEQTGLLTVAGPAAPARQPRIYVDTIPIQTKK